MSGVFSLAIFLGHFLYLLQNSGKPWGERAGKPLGMKPWMAVLGQLLSHGDKRVTWPGLPFWQYACASRPVCQLMVSPGAILVKDNEPGKKERKASQIRRQNTNLVSLRWGCEMSACRMSDLQAINPVLLLLLFVRRKASCVCEFSFILSFTRRGMHSGICVLS